MPDASHDSDTPARSSAVRRFGRLQLLRLLGKSERTMAWRVAEPRGGQEWMLVLPRQQPPDAEALAHWQQATRQAARLNHPQLAAVVETGVQDGWPFVAYELNDSATLAERVTRQGLPGADAAAIAAHLLRGLAYAHEAGVAHHDPQPYLVLVSDSGQVRLAGLAVAAGSTPGWGGPRVAAQSPAALRWHRAAAERDVLAAGVLLHGMLAGVGALDEPDTGRVIARLPPLGREIVRLPWTTANAVADPLRAIVNRATDRQERQRYRNPRTLLRALEGWLQIEAAAGGGPLALLSDRLRTVGVLPSLPGAAARAARLALMERERTNDLAEVVLQDLAHSFEILRLVNSAQVRGAQVAGSGPVLTVRRAIAMLGVESVRRSALALRAWPGPLGEEGAAELLRLVDRCKRAGRAALALRPAGYDGEVVYMITLLQSLGRLVVHYHFAEEAQQIRRLMQPAPPLHPGEREQPGMTEEAASFAVIGADVEAIGAAVARWWGLDESVLAMILRLPLATPVRGIEGDDEMLRAVASCANEAVDALVLPEPHQTAALQRVVQRYGRGLDIGLRELRAALQDPGALPAPPDAETAHAPLQAPTPPGSLAAAVPR